MRSNGENGSITGKRNMFATAMKAISFAWQTNRRLFLLLVILYVFQGSVVYLQFTRMLEHGHIFEQGSHKELMKLGEKYAELYTMQAKRYLEPEEN